MIDAEPLTVLLVHLPPRPTTSFGRSPVRTGGLPQKEGVFTDLRIYGGPYVMARGVGRGLAYRDFVNAGCAFRPQMLLWTANT